MRLAIGILLWTLVGVSSIYYEVVELQHRDLTLGSTIVLGIAGVGMGPIATAIVVFIHVTDNWNTVIIKGSPNAVDKEGIEG